MRALALMLAAATVAMLGIFAGSHAAMAQTTQADPPRRAPPQIIVTPRRSYAVPDRGNSVAYPGRGYVRSCTSWLEPDARPSGTVIVPRQHCGWVRGQS